MTMIAQENIGLIEGTLYPFLNKSFHSHEYFIEKNWQLGRLTYKGQTFEVNMLYNTFHDLLLIQNATNSSTKMEPLKLAQLKELRIPDQRRLLDWQFLSQIDSSQKTGFYTSDILGTYDVLITGISASGELIKEIRTLVVE